MLYDVKLPSGLVVRVDAPEGASPKQIENMAVQQHLQEQFAQFEADTALEAPGTAARLGAGAADVTQGLGQLALRGGEALGVVDPATRQGYEERVGGEREAYAQGEALLDEDQLIFGMDPLRLAGQIGTTGGLGGAANIGTRGLLAAGARALPKTAAMLGGAAGAGTLYTDPDAEGDIALQKVMDTGTGAVGGFVGAAAAQLGGKALTAIGNKLAPKVRAAFNRMAPSRQERFIRETEEAIGMPLGDLPDGVQKEVLEEGLAQFRSGQPLDGAAIARKARFERLGIEPTTGQVTRNPAQFTQEQEAAKLFAEGEVNPMASRFTEQRGRVGQIIDELNTRFGRPERAGGETLETVQQIGRESQQAVGKLYDDAAQAGTGVRVPGERQLYDDLTTVYNDFSDALPGPVKSRIEKITGQATDPLDEGLEPTVSNLVDLQKLINKRTPANPSEQAALTQAGNAVRAALDDAGARGVEGATKIREASQAAARRFGFIKGPRNKQTATVQSIIDGKMSDDSLARKVLSTSSDDLDNLRRFLVAGPEGVSDMTAERGLRAWDSVRGSYIKKMTDSLLGPTGNSFNASSFAREWKNLGNRKKVLFSPQEIAYIDDLTETLADIFVAPAGNAVNRSNTGSAMFNRMREVAREHPSLRFVSDMIQTVVDRNAQRAGVQVPEQALRAPVVPPAPAPLQLPPLPVAGAGAGAGMALPAAAPGMVQSLLNTEGGVLNDSMNQPGR